MLRMIICDLRFSPLRMVLTGLSMGVGVLALIASVVIGSIGRDYLEAVNARLTGWAPTYTVRVEGAQMTDMERNTMLRHAAGEFVPGRLVVRYEIDSLGVRLADDSFVSATVIVTTDSWTSVFPMAQERGRWLTPEERPSAPEIVSNVMAQNMMSDDGFIVMGVHGETNEAVMRVVGVVDDGMQEPVLYANAASMEQFFPQMWRPTGLILHCHPTSGNADEQITREAIDDLVYDTVGGHVVDWLRSDNANSYEQVITFLQFGALSCAILLLLVAGIGVVNIGLAGIEQRARELLIRRALGATRLDIMLLVMGSSVLLSLIVAIVSIVLSVAAVVVISNTVLNNGLVAMPPYPATAALSACVAASMTALLGSLVPAVKAASLQPALALR